MTAFRRSLAGAICAVALALPAAAHDYAAEALSIIHPWIPAPPPGAPVAAGFVTIANDGEEPDRLVAVRADFAGVVQIHEMAVNDEGVMQMRPLPDGLPLAAGDVVVLEPGGTHIMFMRPGVELVVGERLEAVLVFEHAGEITVEFEVQEGHGMGHGEQMSGEGMHGDDMHVDDMGTNHGAMDSDAMDEMESPMDDGSMWHETEEDEQ